MGTSQQDDLDTQLRRGAQQGAAHDPGTNVERTDTRESCIEALLNLGIRSSQARLIRRYFRDMRAGKPSLADACAVAGVSAEMLARALSRVLGANYMSFFDLALIDEQAMRQMLEDRTRAGDALKTLLSTAGEESYVPGYAWNPKAGTSKGIVVVASETAYHNVRRMVDSRGWTIMVGSPRTLRTIYRRYLAPGSVDFDREYEQLARRAREVSGTGVDLESGGADGSTLERMLVGVLRAAAFSAASDIQCIPFGEARGGAIKFRVDGVYETFRYLEAGIYQRLINRLRDLTQVTTETLSKKILTEGSFINAEGQDSPYFKALRTVLAQFLFRVEVGAAKMGCTVTIRILDREGVTADFRQLGFLREDADYLAHLMDYSAGLILVTGPTGSGKTTTLNGMLSLVDPEPRSVQSIEFPVEYIDPRRLQYEVPTTSESEEGKAREIFKGVLRNDPDTVQIGEIRDAGMARLSFDASNTGHLVLSTLHTRDSVSAVTRLRELGVPNAEIASELLCIIGQRLVRKVCPYCSEDDTREDTHRMIGLFGYGGGAKPKKASSDGCERCHNTGYRGRVMVYEVLRMEQRLRQAIEAGGAPSALESIGRPKRRSMWGFGLLLVAKGEITIDELHLSVPPMDIDESRRATDNEGSDT